MERIQKLEDPDLIEVLYGDFVRKIFQGYRVMVTPGRPTPGATGVPQLVELDQSGGRYGRVRLYDNLVVISGPPGSLRDEHLAWLKQLRDGMQARLDELKTAREIDLLTGLGSERRFHDFVGGLARKERWVGWLMCVTLLPVEGTLPTLDQVEEICRQVADFLRGRHPSSAHLFRMSNGFFAGMVPGLSAEDTVSLIAGLREELPSLHLPGSATLKCFIGAAALGSGKRQSLLFYQKLMEALQNSSGADKLTLSDLRRARPGVKPEGGEIRRVSKSRRSVKSDEGKP